MNTVFFILFLFSSVCFAEREKILPTANYELKNSRTADFGGTHWFTRIETGAHPSLKGTYGGGFAVGRKVGDLFVDFAAAYHKTVFSDVSYHYMSQYNYDYTNTENASFDRSVEYSKHRDAGANGSLITLAPGAGYFFKFFGSDDIFEIFKMKFGYAHYEHSLPQQTFDGYVFGLSGAVGFDIGRIVLSPGISWDLMKMSRSDGSKSEHASKNHLPLMLWTMNINAYVFMF